MTGLEKIISQIEYDSDDRCRNTIAQANEKAEKIIDEAKAEAEKIKSDSMAQTEKMLDNMKQSAASSAELTRSKIILQSKLEAIDDMLGKALDALKSLPEEEYFEILETLIVNNAKSGEGVLRLSEKDSARIPSDFVGNVNSKLGDKSVKLGESADIDINCSFDAIASSKRDELRDALNALLFG